jgi:Glyoxalase-like domain
MIWIDHVIVATPDLDGAATRMLDGFGLDSIPGGRHTGLGTGNRVVPLGRDYIELMGVVDVAEARTSSVGRWVLEATGNGDRLLGWCLATDDLDRVASERNLQAVAMERVRPDGVVLRWRLAGLEVAMAEPGMPFFIQWDVPEPEHPGRMQVQHRHAVRGITWVEVSGAAERLRKWIGDGPRAHLVVGDPGLVRVGIATAAEELVFPR